MEEGMLSLMGMYISWPILVVIILGGLGIGMLIGALIKSHPTIHKSTTYRESSNSTGRIGGSISSGGSTTNDYEWSSSTKHEDVQKQIQILEQENTKLRKQETALTEKVEKLTKKQKEVEQKLEKIAKELQSEEHPVYNQVMRVISILSRNTVLSRFINGPTEDDLIQDAIRSGLIRHEEKWFDSNGVEVANNRIDLMDYLNNQTFDPNRGRRI